MLAVGPLFGPLLTVDCFKHDVLISVFLNMYFVRNKQR